MSENVQRDLRWKLAGIQAEQQTTQNYLNFLREQESLVRNQLMVGAPTPTTGKVKGKTARKTKNQTVTTGTGIPKRKRQISPEQRQKMADAARKRWAERKGQASPETTSAASPVAPDFLSQGQVQ